MNKYDYKATLESITKIYKALNIERGDVHCMDTIIHALEIMVKVEDGYYKIVPETPTNKMIEHAVVATRAANVHVIGKFEGLAAKENVLMNACYTAMIAAAPVLTEL